MSTDFDFRRSAVRELTRQIGVYILSDLDNVPLYVGQSKDGIRQRVQRHLTSARSDIIANRQIDVWEIAFVWAYPVHTKSELNDLETALFYKFDAVNPLMNGKRPDPLSQVIEIPEPTQIIQVIPDGDLDDKRSPSQRLPRQAVHYAAMVDHFLSIKNSGEIARAMNAHFLRLQRYHEEMQRSEMSD